MAERINSILTAIVNWFGSFVGADEVQTWPEIGFVTAAFPRAAGAYERTARHPRDRNSGTNASPTNSRSSGRSMRG